MFDGLSGLEEAFKEMYPKADVQHCIVHKLRSTANKIRVKDRADVLGDLKAVYTAENRNMALTALDTVQAKWGKVHPKEI